jgi:hypothetical protein
MFSNNNKNFSDKVVFTQIQLCLKCTVKIKVSFEENNPGKMSWTKQEGR